MQIVIDITEKLYKALKQDDNEGDAWDAVEAIINGTPLPKGHGALKDVSKFVYECGDKFRCAGVCSCYNCQFHIIQESDIDKLPTIIEADKEGNGDADSN